MQDLRTKVNIILHQIESNRMHRFMENKYVQSFQDFYINYKNMLWKKELSTKIESQYSPFKNLNLIITLKELFKMLKNTVIFRQKQRDGRIFNCFINENQQFCIIYPGLTSEISTITK
ncbi:unnamed protein product (macronuclear) [Paramecium tetraurelia]|uniref:Uncharacterized protein n=1 Tax=Paramecium tetraurelia TaxID=5888 RepID=A0ECU3_PARTE|nr:uncharacterized protein GSPATT00003979001 [Paramecium tetraurelia]CAK93110.1 unnamed protein product [Paramecium tetraurelia]|eukprot:XP_001460507.1 hypothetical protein (macronuclear) [Paramecium tetraurelia strain d4-2]